MAESILKLRVESSEYDQKIKRAAEGLQAYAEGCRKAGGTLTQLDDGVLEFTKALGNMETVSKTARGSVSEMTKAFTELSVQYNKLTEEEKNSPFGKALSESLNTLKGRIQEGKTELDDINKSLNGGGGLKDALDQVAGKFGLNIDMVTKFGGVIGVTTTALKVAKDAFFQSESNIDEWGRTVKGAEGAYDIFLQTLNNGNWSGFFQNLQAAIQGGRDLYDVFDRLGSIKSNNAAAIALTQKEIAELRLAKQQGENVDAKLKAATERLATLQKQSVTAGQTAGTQSAFQTIRNSVNSIGGAGVNDATIKYAVDRIMKYGQSEFDKYKSNRDILYQRGMVTKTQTINDSQGGTYERQYREFNINALTKKEQKQYALAQAITEGEKRIQKGISAYAQAVIEGTSAAREQFKGNRYALQGSGGGGGKGGGGNIATGPTYDAGSLAEAQSEVQRLSKLWNEAGADVRDQYLQPLIEAEAKVKSMQNAMSLQKEQAQGKLNAPKLWQGDIDDMLGNTKGVTNLSDSAIQSLEQIREHFQKNPIVIPIESPMKKIEAIQKGARQTAQVVGTIGQAFNAIDDPAAKVMGTVAQAIANVAMAYSQALADDPTLKTSIWGLIAAAAASTVSMVSTIASIHSATGYAEGGMIKGNSYSGDNLMAMGPSGLIGLNAGEIVLNQAQQANVASGLRGGALGGMSLKTKVRGTELLIWMDNALAQSGRGEMVTWGP